MGSVDVWQIATIELFSCAFVRTRVKFARSAAI
jgi:hypothetical protein